MSSSFSTLKASFLEIVSDTLDILEQLHTASIEFTVKRENGSILGLEVTYQCLLAEQKQDLLPDEDGMYVKKDGKWCKFDE